MSKQIKIKCVLKGNHVIQNKKFTFNEIYEVDKNLAEYLVAKEDMGRPMFMVVHEKKVDEKQRELDVLDAQEKVRDENSKKLKERIKKIKEPQKKKIKEQEKKIEQAQKKNKKNKKKKNKDNFDKFGPLKGTPEWENLSQGKKSSITRKRNKRNDKDEEEPKTETKNTKGTLAEKLNS